VSSLYLLPGLAASHEGDTVTVAGVEARHAVTVNRLRAGETIRVGNGKGLVVTGDVLESRSDQFSIRVTKVTEVPRRAPELWLVQALAKGGRDEMAIQAATELGIDVVIPWAAQRSVVRWDGAKSAKGPERWGAIVREATKQSIRPWLPDVHPLASTSTVAALAASMRVLVLEPTAARRLTDVDPDDRDVVLVVGPEGGIAPAELEQLEVSGAQTVRLGDTVLRTSTAGPAALAVLNARLDRW
jgi:16S rRNA (uracil1498-N3)-methyltransferase